MGRRRKGGGDPSGYKLVSLRALPEPGQWEAQLRYIGQHTQRPGLHGGYIDHSIRMVIMRKRTRAEAEKYVKNFLKRRRYVASFNNRLVEREP